MLAQAQAQEVAQRLEEATGDHFSLQVITTRGDLLKDRPLWQIEGQNFFTRELDQALLEGKVDLNVHSYKDLGSERPRELALAAVTERRFSQDILLVKKQAFKAIPPNFPLLVGTSSPRRMAQVEREGALSSLLPGHPPVKTVPLRGNIPTRLKKMQEGAVHAVILAFAGLERLAQAQKEALSPLLHPDDLDFVILPPSLFPCSASQGALAIECLKKRQGDLLPKISSSSLHHPDTAEETARERRAFATYGGGCHVAMGVHVKKIKPATFLHIHRGTALSKMWLETTETPPPAAPPAPPTSVSPKGAKFIGLGPDKVKDPHFVCDRLIERALLPWPQALSSLPSLLHPHKRAHLFSSTSYCAEAAKRLSAQGRTLWAAGVQTMRKLVAQGLWVHGSADPLGEKQMIRPADSRLLGLLLGEESASLPWCVLGHEEGTSSLGGVLPVTKRRILNVKEEYREELKRVKHFYWTSLYQYETFRERFPFLDEKSRTHYCGPGKTWEHFTNKGIPVKTLSGIEEFKRTI